MASAIVARARVRNAALDVTGTLMATENHFAQMLEGPRDAIDSLMRSIGRDPRHRDLVVVQDASCANRRFARWSLAYHGTSSYFEGFIRPLVAPAAPLRADVDRLVDLLVRLVAPKPRPLSRDHPLP